MPVGDDRHVSAQAIVEQGLPHCGGPPAEARCPRIPAQRLAACPWMRTWLHHLAHPATAPSHLVPGLILGVPLPLAPGVSRAALPSPDTLSPMLTGCPRDSPLCPSARTIACPPAASHALQRAQTVCGPDTQASLCPVRARSRASSRAAAPHQPSPLTARDGQSRACSCGSGASSGSGPGGPPHPAVRRAPTWSLAGSPGSAPVRALPAFGVFDSRGSG